MTVTFWFFIVLLMLLAISLIAIPFFHSRDQKNNRFSLKNFFIFLSCLFLIPLFSIGMYRHWGASQALAHYWQLKKDAAAAKEVMAHLKNPERVIEVLKQHLQKHPESAQGWYLLGRLYLETKDYTQAENVLFKAYHLEPSNLSYSMAYAEVLFLNHHQLLSLATKQIVTTILSRSPNNVNAINLLAIDAYHRHYYSIAISYWEKLLMQFPTGSQDQQMLLQMISEAQKKLQKKGII